MPPPAHLPCLSISTLLQVSPELDPVMESLALCLLLCVHAQSHIIFTSLCLATTCHSITAHIHCRVRNCTICLPAKNPFFVVYQLITAFVCQPSSR